MEKNTNKKSASALIGAAFLMATSAIGPGFLTQTGQFTGNLKGSFGFVILVSVFYEFSAQTVLWNLCICVRLSELSLLLSLLAVAPVRSP